jgi:4-amino-4-deoxy-L-arabinose transferase-like glycosyltransferase
LKRVSKTTLAEVGRMFARQWPATVIFLSAIVLRFGLLHLSLRQMSAEKLFTASADAANYVAGAVSLLHGGAEHERVFFSFGPGYSSWLAIVMWLFGDKSMAIIYLQILLSSLSCVLVYFLVLRLRLSKATATLAGLLGAISVTSICLSCLPLSDTLYHFVFLLGLCIFVVSIDTGSWWSFIAAGLLFGYSSLVRSIGQFWFIPLTVICMLLVRRTRKHDGIDQPWQRSRYARAGAMILFILLVQMLWMARNYRVHGIWTMAYTSAGGPATVAALSLHSNDEKNYRQTLYDWEEEYLKAHNQTKFVPEEHYRMFQRKALETFRNCPLCFVRAYLGLVWTNLNDIDYLHRILIPQNNPLTIRIEYIFKDHYLNYLGFPLAMLGLLFLGLNRKYRAVLVLAAVYGYFVAMIGAFPWQGSRYFYPGYIAGDILISVVIVGLASLLFRATTRLVRRTASHHD